MAASSGQPRTRDGWRTAKFRPWSLGPVAIRIVVLRMRRPSTAGRRLELTSAATRPPLGATTYVLKMGLLCSDRRLTWGGSVAAAGSPHLSGVLEASAQAALTQLARKATRASETELLANCGFSVLPRSCDAAHEPLGSLVRRARSLSRSKRRRAVVGGSRKLVGAADENATGSAKWPEGVLALPRAFFVA
jgi:hypothetical protein